MTVENGGALPANDTALSSDQATKANENTEPTEGQNTVPVEDAASDDEEDIEYEGEKYRIPRKLREAIAKPMLADYTRKTQELADHRKAFDGEKENWGKQTAAQRAHFEQAAKVIAYNDRLSELDGQIQKYANVDWVALAQNPEQYQQHRAYYDSLKDQRDNLRNQRDTAARAWSDKEREYSEAANRERGERMSKAQAEIAKLVEGWAPGNELDQKLAAYGNSIGLSNEAMADMAIREPKLVRELNRLRQYDEAAQKQKTQETFQQSQQAKPVTRVGGGGGSAARKTTDSSGDALSMEEWVKRERERLAKRA